jgi:hypothetical protein
MSTIIDGLDYGPIACLVGTWQGDKGMDIAPDQHEPDGVERNPYYETITFEAIGDAKNADTELLAVVRYHQVVSRKSNNEVFHDQVGYWIYKKTEDLVMHTLTIPRAVSVLAGGSATVKGTETTLEVKAALGDPDWGVVQSPFMRDNASTKAFEMTMVVDGDKMNYRESTILEIYGNKSFDHRDKSELVRVSK